MALLTLCMAFISLSNIYDQPTLIEFPPENATWLEEIKYRPITPVILAFLATMLLGINMNIVKYYDRRGFPSDVFAYTCYGVTNLV